MDFKVTAYIASGKLEKIVGTVEYFRASDAECISMINDLASIPFAAGDWGDEARIVGAVYHKRDGTGWRSIDSSETLGKHMDWCAQPLRGQPR